MSMSEGKLWRAGIKRVLCILVLVLAVIMTLRTSWIVSTSLLDSDTSSELILAEKLAREGGILSKTWFYSTELQVIDCQIIYKLFFLLTSDWSLVRFLGCTVMQLMMLGAFGFLARQARMPFNRFCLGGAALLLPFSVPYGRIVLYHNYYAFHVIFALMTVGLYLGILRRAQQEKYWKRWPFWLCVAGEAAVSFGAGLNGVRQLMVCTVPLAAAALLSAMVSERGKLPEQQNRFRASLPAIGWGLFPFLMSGAGYLVNIFAFASQYSYTDYTGMYVSMGNLGVLSEILRNFLITLGFHDYCDLFTLHGLLGIGAFLIWLITVLLGFHTLRNTKDPAARFLWIFMFMVHLVMVCVFMLLSLEGFRMELYFLPVTFWILPALGKADLRPDSGLPQEEKKKAFPAKLLAGDAPLSVHGLVATLVLVLFLANGVYYTLFFRDPKTWGKQIEYNGLSYGETQTVEALQPVADYLKENGYTLVYADYWDGAVITELTDGQVKSVPIELGNRKHPLKYSNWLGDNDLRDPDFVSQQKAAILANFDIATNLEEGNQYGAVESTSFGGKTLFDMPDPATLAKDLWD